MAIDPPYRLDPFRSIINIHFEPSTIECPPEGEGYPGVVIIAAPYGDAAITTFVDFYMAINSTGPHSSGNPLSPAEEHPTTPPALCIDAGELLEERIGTGSGMTYVSAVSVVVPYVTNPETGGPSPEVFAATVAFDWNLIEDFINTTLNSLEDGEALRPYAEAAFEAAKEDYNNSIAANSDGQQHPSNDTAETNIAICGETG